LRGQVHQRRQSAEEALAAAQEQLRRQQYAEALQTLAQGLNTAQGLWWGGGQLVEQFRGQVQLTQRAHAAHNLHMLADRARFLFSAAGLLEQEMRALEQHCAKVWELRALITGRVGGKAESAADPGVQADLLDLAILWTDLRVGLDPEGRKDAARREALGVLD